MTLNFQTSGLHTVTMNTIDRYDSNTYTITVDVFDSYPLYITKVDDGSGHFYVEMEDTYIDQIPTANIFLTDIAPTFTVIETTWNICNDETGTCDGLYEENLDITRSLVGWSTELSIPSSLCQTNSRDRPVQCTRTITNFPSRLSIRMVMITRA